MLTNQHAHFALLPFDGTACVYHRQSKFRNHAIVLFEDSSLEDLETFFRIVGPAEVQAGFVILEVWSAGNDAIDRDVEWGAEKESHCWFDGEVVDVADPAAIAAARDVAGERRVDVAIGEHDCACFERRNDVALGAIGEVSRVQQRERRGCEQVALLGPSCRILDERG